MTKKRVFRFGDGSKIETFVNSKEQHDEAVGLIVSRIDEHDGYSVEDIDPEMVNVWISDAHAEGDELYAEFLRSALAAGADIYTLYEEVGGWKQAVGDAALYH